MSEKTAVCVDRKACKLGDNIFFLIATVDRALRDNGESVYADEFSKRLDIEANSPSDVLKIAKEYVRVV